MQEKGIWIIFTFRKFQEKNVVMHRPIAKVQLGLGTALYSVILE